MAKLIITNEELKNIGYVYVGEYGGHTKEHPANQLWRWRDELVLYDTEEQQIIWRETNEPRFQTKQDYEKSRAKT